MKLARSTLALAAQLALASAASAAPGSVSLPSADQLNAVDHPVTAALSASLVAKASAGNLYGFNCKGVTGSSPGFCVAISANASPSNGASIAPLDVCYFSGADGCALARNIPDAYGAGIVVLVTVAASPFTFTTGATAFISADVK